MSRLSALTATLALGGVACSNSGDASVTMRSSGTSTTFVTLPVPSTTAPRATVAGGEGGDSAGGSPNAAGDEAQSPGGERTYTVRSGDYLVRIASQFEVTVQEIVEYNGWEGLNHALNPGDEIRIPPIGGVETVPPEGTESIDSTVADAAACPDGEGQQTYTIQSGDTKGRVAADFDTTVAELDAANVDTRFYAGFVIGIEILIPC